MRTIAKLGLALAIVVGLVAVATAADQTLTGQVMCAKCALKKADAKECQNVLVVKGEGDKTTEYYIVKNAVADKFGHVCTGSKPATVTGSVEEKDGKTWITPTKMAEMK